MSRSESKHVCSILWEPGPPFCAGDGTGHSSSVMVVSYPSRRVNGRSKNEPLGMRNGQESPPALLGGRIVRGLLKRLNGCYLRAKCGQPTTQVAKGLIRVGSAQHSFITSPYLCNNCCTIAEATRS